LVIMAKTPSSRGPCLPLPAAQAARESTTVVLDTVNNLFHVSNMTEIPKK
jgi:hypothetical protein